MSRTKPRETAPRASDEAREDSEERTCRQYIHIYTAVAREAGEYIKSLILRQRLHFLARSQSNERGRRCQSRTQRVESRERRRDRFHAFCQMSSSAILHSGRAKPETETSLVYSSCALSRRRKRERCIYVYILVQLLVQDRTRNIRLTGRNNIDPFKLITIVKLNVIYIIYF